MQTMRSQVLSLYKSIHRTAQNTFKGDQRAIQAAREKIREEFSKNKNESDPKVLKKLLKTGQDVQLLLKTSVAQGVHRKEGLYALRIHEHLLREDNAPLPTASKEDR